MRAIARLVLGLTIAIGVLISVLSEPSPREGAPDQRRVQLEQAAPMGALAMSWMAYERAA
jgi:hypothetical protein